MDSNSSEKPLSSQNKITNPKQFAWRIFLQAGEQGKGFFT